MAGLRLRCRNFVIIEHRSAELQPVKNNNSLLVPQHHSISTRRVTRMHPTQSLAILLLPVSALAAQVNLCATRPALSILANPPSYYDTGCSNFAGSATATVNGATVGGPYGSKSASTPDPTKSGVRQDPGHNPCHFVYRFLQEP